MREDDSDWIPKMEFFSYFTQYAKEIVSQYLNGPMISLIVARRSDDDSLRLNSTNQLRHGLISRWLFPSAKLVRAQLPCSRRAFLRNAWTGSNGWHALRCSESSRTRRRDFDGTQRWTVALRRRTMQGMNSGERENDAGY